LHSAALRRVVRCHLRAVDDRSPDDGLRQLAIRKVPRHHPRVEREASGHAYRGCLKPQEAKGADDHRAENCGDGLEPALWRASA
jgi:hypothetical protein